MSSVSFMIHVQKSLSPFPEDEGNSFLFKAPAKAAVSSIEMLVGATEICAFGVLSSFTKKRSYEFRVLEGVSHMTLGSISLIHSIFPLNALNPYIEDTISAVSLLSEKAKHAYQICL